VWQRRFAVPRSVHRAGLEARAFADHDRQKKLVGIEALK